MQTMHGRKPAPLPAAESLGPYHDDGDMGLFPPGSAGTPSTPAEEATYEG